MKKEIENIIGYWLANRKNTMNFSLLEKGIQNLLDKQREEIKEIVGDKLDELMINPGEEDQIALDALEDILKELNK